MRKLSIILLILTVFVFNIAQGVDDIKSLYNLGKKYYAEGRYTQAIETFQKVLSIDPTHKWAKKYLQISQEKLSKLEDEKLLTATERQGPVPGLSSPLVGEEKGEGKQSAPDSTLSKEEIKDYYKDAKKLFKEDAAGAINAFILGLSNVQKSGGDTIGILDQIAI